MSSPKANLVFHSKLTPELFRGMGEHPDGDGDGLRAYPVAINVLGAETNDSGGDDQVSVEFAGMSLTLTPKHARRLAVQLIEGANASDGGFVDDEDHTDEEYLAAQEHVRAKGALGFHIDRFGVDVAALPPSEAIERARLVEQVEATGPKPVADGRSRILRGFEAATNASFGPGRVP